MGNQVNCCCYSILNAAATFPWVASVFLLLVLVITHHHHHFSWGWGDDLYYFSSGALCCFITTDACFTFIFYSNLQSTSTAVAAAVFYDHKIGPRRLAAFLTLSFTSAIALLLIQRRKNYSLVYCFCKQAHKHTHSFLSLISGYRLEKCGVHAYQLGNSHQWERIVNWNWNWRERERERADQWFITFFRNYY